MTDDFSVLVELVRTTLADESIEFGLFRVAESEHGSSRRVVWIPTEFTCKSVFEANPLRDYDTGELGDTLFTDLVSVECQIIGLDFADACEIRKQVCNAARQCLGLSSRPMDGAFVTELEGQSGVMWGGKSKIIQRFQWQLNMPKVAVGLGGSSTIVKTIELREDLTNDGITATENLTVITAP